jgi:hypothetical protein
MSNAMRTTLGALALGLTLAAPAQAALSFSIDPGALFLGAGAFTADTLLATEASHIAFTSATDWTEVGFARITGATLGGSPVTTAGLNADYTLYFSFQGTGREAANPGDPGSFTSMVMDLYAVAGAATFGIDANNDAFIDTGGATPVKLAGTTFIDGTTSLVGTQMSATLLGHFTPLVPSFFTALPNPPLLFGDFHHVVGPGGDVTPVAGGFVIQGGDDRLYFVPAPAPLALLAFAALVLPIRRRVPRLRRCRRGFASLYSS